MKIGDKVEVVNYGSKLWITKNMVNQFGGLSSKWVILKEGEKDYVIDWDTELIGQKGVITNISSGGDFELSGIKGKCAWYHKEQLKLIE